MVGLRLGRHWAEGRRERADEGREGLHAVGHATATKIRGLLACGHYK